MSSSTESVSDDVPYLVPLPTTKFWITATAANAQIASRGVAYDVLPASGDWELASASTITAIGLVFSTSSEDAAIQQRDTESADSWVVISIVSTPVSTAPGAN